MALVKTCKKPPMSIISASGSICTFNALQEGLPLKSHTVSLVAKQAAGTPSPSFPLPISGWDEIGICATGKNLWGGNAVVFGIKSTIPTATEGTDYIEFASNASDNGYFTRSIKFKTNTQYTFIFSIQNPTALRSNMRVMYDDSSFSNIPNITDNNKQTLVWTSDANKTIVGLAKRNAGGETRLYYDECCLLEGVKTVDDFEPFGTYTTIQIGSTIYGGEYDAITGMFTVTTCGVDMGSLSWGKSTVGDYTVFYATPEPYKNNNIENMLCSIYSVVNKIRTQLLDGEMGLYNSNNETNWRRIAVRDDTRSNLTGNEFASAVSGQTVKYKLETPQLIQLPPCQIDTLLGENNIWADTGVSSIEAYKIGR